ncbi:MAG: hypothetical protein ACK5CU_05445, partial [Rhodoluna sp.]
IDLKSDRQNKTLLVQSAWLEKNLTKEEQTKYSKAITKHLEDVRKWQQLEKLERKAKGNMP